MGKRKTWTKQEEDFLAEAWEDGTEKDTINERLKNRTWAAIQQKAKRLNLTRGQKSPTEGDSILNPYYVSGFCDGGGYFRAYFHSTTGSLIMMFGVKLRKDDLWLLEEIQRFFNSGAIYTGHASLEQRKKHHREGGKPYAELQIFRKKEIEENVIPHFTNYPLLGKKRRDFEIWKQIAEIRKRFERGKDNSPLKEEIKVLIKKLEEIREYEEPERGGFRL